MWCLTVVASATAYSDEVQATATTATTKKTQNKYENSIKASRLHFSDLQYIYTCSLRYYD